MADQTLRPRRSVLYMPGANERALEKAKGIDADALILDLEDAVAPDAKVEARERVCAAVVPAGEPPDPDALRAWLSERLAPYKLPRRWLLVPDLPRNAMGKVVKADVRALFA